jgi:hypothetical protein
MTRSTRSHGVAEAFGSLKRASNSAVGLAFVSAHLLRQQVWNGRPFRIMPGVATTRCDLASDLSTCWAACIRSSAPASFGQLNVKWLASESSSGHWQ